MKPSCLRIPFNLSKLPYNNIAIPFIRLLLTFHLLDMSNIKGILLATPTPSVVQGHHVDALSDTN